MGNGASTKGSIPDLEEFKIIASEYDKLKSVGLSSEELHMILRKRMQDPSVNEEISKQRQLRADDNYGGPSKGDGTPRAAETAPDSVPAVDSRTGTNEAPAESSSAAAAAVIEEPQGPTGLVLLIDDSPVAARVAAKVLQQLNFEVVTANSAKKGYDILKARSEEVLLVFLDVVMPQVDGVECLSWIKENADVSHIPVYMLSGLEDQLLADVCQERGAEGMLLKPLNHSKLKDILSAHGIDCPTLAAEPSKAVPAGGAAAAAAGSKAKNSTNLNPTRSTERTGGGGSGVSTEEKSNSINSNDSSSNLAQAPLGRNGRSNNDHDNSQAHNRSSNSAPPESNSYSEEDHLKNNDSGNIQNSDNTTPEPQRKGSTLSTAGVKLANRNMLTDGSKAPAFKLCDSDLQLFHFPPVANPVSTKQTRQQQQRQQQQQQQQQQHSYLVFIPSVYCSELYEENGFLSQLFDVYEEIVARHELVVCITADLPFALSAAKTRFNMPFTLLSDPSLFISQRYVGTVDIGSILARPLENEHMAVDHSSHIQNSFLGPHLGILYVHNKTRDVLKKWVSCNAERGEEPVLTAFPRELLTWSQKYGSSKGGDSGHGGGSASTSENGNKKHHPLGRNISSGNSNTNHQVGAKSEGQTGKAAATATATTAEAAGDNVMRILIVDDSSVSSRVAAKKLQTLGYEVSVAYNGQMGYDMLKKEPTQFTVVLTDVVMPVCDGVELLRMIKADEELLHIPVFMLSGLEGESLNKSCLEAGAALLLKKPFDEKQFHSCVQNILQSRQT